MQRTGSWPKEHRLRKGGGWGGGATGDSWPREKVIGAPGVIQRAKRSLLDQGKLSGAGGILAWKDG